MISAHQKALVFSNQADSSAHSIEGATPADDQIAVPGDMEAELQHYNFLLEQLLGLISSGEDESVSRVLSVIRSGGSHRQILDMIEQQSESEGKAERNGAT
ncbi:hypothetical protein N7448_009645 [Penicillium atrosanguineum]|uniref:Uncharacterized protein n=1 Tax=Penicillium atrosanguineum TaxID=1132637 RepID=A0A9W9KWU5_9EURO|nr:uncharacterized protein N7443_006891 [Penicillium atrosanguineum]KAJ5123548.1 hypothetical protein N7448_009645 [Penicillium atrosanguineum]KAJ5142177.1 hypothetical protein N7526_003172 [Penicillium atrosanguineum]KAJ5298771.1 hypothetical protein N7443_006891 [Penicillium atrosanguineum]KAJ5320964.1 hypothetical protein N7476_003966 [Penicillium atrosanguineum]